MNRISLCLFPNGTNKCLTMSFDDGREDDIKLVEIFNKYGIRGTFHLNSGFWGKENYITKDIVKSLYKGHEVSCHMATHPWPSDIPAVNIVHELVEDRINIEKTCDCIVRGMSYPYGNYNDEVIKVCKSVGIEYSRTTQATNKFDIPEDFMKWHPTCKHNMGILDKAQEFLADDKYRRMRLFYVWGHSFEFPRDNNWDIIEEFCKCMGGRDDIWYATNIEIYDYIMATKALRFSADLDRVYNPSSIDVWIRVNDEPVRIPSGQYVSIG